MEIYREIKQQRAYIDALAAECLSKVIEWQRHLHQIPETGMEEVETSRFIMEALSQMGIPFRKVDPTGILADFGRGKRCIALRADMDGLRVQEATDLPWKSRHEGYMHACGHDGHAAALLGIAWLLKTYGPPENIKVRLIFQPSEENCKGAKHMIRSGALEGVDAIYGLHLFADIPTGVISLDAGPRMAITDRFSVRLHGKGGHAGKPHQCVDTTVAAAAMVMNLQTIVSRRLDPVESGVLTIGRLTSGSQYNVIAETASFEGTIRAFDAGTEAAMHRDFCHMVREMGNVYGVKADIDYHPSEHPVVYNDPKRSEKLGAAARSLWGDEVVKTIPPIMLGEDFSVYQTMVPGVFAFVGTGNQEKGWTFPNHHPSFCLDPEAIRMALKVYLLYILQGNGDERS